MKHSHSFDSIPFDFCIADRCIECHSWSLLVWRQWTYCACHNTLYPASRCIFTQASCTSFILIGFMVFVEPPSFEQITSFTLFCLPQWAFMLVCIYTFKCIWYHTCNGCGPWLGLMFKHHRPLQATSQSLSVERDSLAPIPPRRQICLWPHPCFSTAHPS